MFWTPDKDCWLRPCRIRWWDMLMGRSYKYMRPSKAGAPLRGQMACYPGKFRPTEFSLKCREGRELKWCTRYRLVDARLQLFRTFSIEWLTIIDQISQTFRSLQIAAAILYVYSMLTCTVSLPSSDHPRLTCRTSARLLWRGSDKCMYVYM